MGKFILIDDNLKPKDVAANESKEEDQSKLFEKWIADQKKKDETMLPKEKRPKIKDPIITTWVLGSKDRVSYSRDVGFFASVLCAYNNHWVLETSPEDWWITISQKVAVTIDKHAKEQDVRDFFVSHEGRKKLVVSVESPSIYGVDYERFFKAMTGEISKNINNPEYTELMDCSFSESTSIQKMVNQIMLMNGFKDYFQYCMMPGCGIPGVTMTGSEEDWKMIIEKHDKLKKFLEPLDDILELSGWFESSKKVLEKLLETFQGNPDIVWWSKIISKIPYGPSGMAPYPGGPCDYGGWLVKDFLGLGSRMDLADMPSGINVVPLTIVQPGGYEEEADIVAGVTGYDVIEDGTEVGDSKYPVVKTALGWGLLLKPDSKFR